MEAGSAGDLKRAALESVNGSSDPESKPITQYSRDEVRGLLEEVLNSDIAQREIADTADNVADKVRRALWPEFEVEAKKAKAEKDVERKAMLMHLKELIGEANGRGN
jgi:hypothetical protein